MEKAEEISINKVEALKKTAIFSILLGIAIIMPAIVHQQMITGPIVNATLFLATFLLAPEIAIFVGLLPSIIALSSGLLPAPLAPMVPFIMISNSILILVFYYFKKKNFWIAIFIASILKFLFLYSTSFLVIDLLLKKELAKQVSLMMSWPQLLTALVGGTIAYILLKVLKKI
jgi:hypothetical protein